MALFEATPNRERAKLCPEDLSFQSFTQHATLFLTRFNIEFEISVFFIGKWVRAHLVSPRTADGHLGAGTGRGHIWRTKSIANNTVILRRLANRAGVSARLAVARGRGPCGWAKGSLLRLL